MRRVAPSTVVREEIGELLAGGVAPETNILSALAQLGVRYVVQQGLEQEQADHRGHTVMSQWRKAVPLPAKEFHYAFTNAPEPGGVRRDLRAVQRARGQHGAP